MVIFTYSINNSNYMNSLNEGGSSEDLQLSEEQMQEMKKTRRELMADPLFRVQYDELKEKTTPELEDMVKDGNKPGNEFNPANRDFKSVAVFNAVHFLLYERKVLDGTWPLDKTAY